MKDLISKESVVKSRMMSKNTFKDMSNGVIAISGPGWARPAYASVKDDFIDELKSLTWAVKDKKYLYCSKLKMYLHQYMIKNGMEKKNLINRGHVIMQLIIWIMMDIIAELKIYTS